MRPWAWAIGSSTCCFMFGIGLTCGLGEALRTRGHLRRFLAALPTSVWLKTVTAIIEMKHSSRLFRQMLRLPSSKLVVGTHSYRSRLQTALSSVPLVLGVAAPQLAHRVRAFNIGTQSRFKNEFRMLFAKNISIFLKFEQQRQFTN